ncbi:MAG: amino-acid N-acetyltransferase [Halofilum sp. (in: g-proteobacteria)]|nr:amino-acid N-acetyltransferase [Halofilum sp. (in: g-proteobacteria)]
MTTEDADPQGHLAWFRNASPYIQAHRGRTFVLAFGGEAVDEPGFAALVHDIALLARLGVRLVLVHGARPQIDARLAQAALTPHYRDGLRITDTRALPLVLEAVGRARIEVESRLSTGLPNTPMAGAGIRVAGGNCVTARPWGMHDGVDFQHTGEVRRIDAEAITAALDRGDIVVLSTLGYSPTGEVFNLHAEDVATEAAVALRADKLLFLMEHAGVRDAATATPHQPARPGRGRGMGRRARRQRPGGPGPPAERGHGGASGRAARAPDRTRGRRAAAPSSTRATARARCVHGRRRLRDDTRREHRRRRRHPGADRPAGDRRQAGARARASSWSWRSSTSPSSSATAR